MATAGNGTAEVNWAKSNKLDVPLNLAVKWLFSFKINNLSFCSLFAEASFPEKAKNKVRAMIETRRQGDRAMGRREIGYNPSFGKIAAASFLSLAMTGDTARYPLLPIKNRDRLSAFSVRLSSRRSRRIKDENESATRPRKMIFMELIFFRTELKLRSGM
jgi:hypothetical protein